MNSPQNNGEYIYEPNFILRGNGSGRHNAELKMWRHAVVIYHLTIPDLILKLYTFNILLFKLFPLQRTKWFPFIARATERIKNLSIIFF